VKNATIHAALNLEQRKDGLYVCIYATKKYDPAVIGVLENGREIFREEALLSPTDVYEKTIPLPIRDFLVLSLFLWDEPLLTYAQSPSPLVPYKPSGLL
jgi:hypothetical protein